jgi:hypothetical protein
MSLPAAYLSQNHTQPLPSKDGGVLRTIGAVTYMLALPRARGELCQRWQQATKLILDQADVAAVSHQMHLALFYDAQLERHQGRRDSRVRSRWHHSWRTVIALCGDWIADTANSERFLLFAQLDVGVLDDLRPFGDVGVDDGSEFVR